MPDIIAYKLEEALDILEAYNYKVVIRESLDRNSTKTGEARVIRKKICNNNTLELVIAYF